MADDLGGILVWAGLAALGVGVSRRLAARRMRRASTSSGGPRRSPVGFEEQLEDLAACGIRLAPGVSPEALLVSSDREAFGRDPYRLLLCVMGGEAEDETQAGETGHPSDDIWHFDTECIEDTGAYAAIARRMSTLARGELPLEEITDHVDVDGKQASLSFRLSGQPHRWEARVENDWVDPAILSRFAGLLASRHAARRFTYIDLDGQDCLIGCATDDERARLERVTGLSVSWLT